MDKTRFIGWFLIFGIILVWFQYQQKELEEKQALRKKAIADSLANLEEEIKEPKKESLKTPELAVKEKAETANADSALTDSMEAAVIPERKVWVITDNFVVGISNKGAAIQDVYLKGLYKESKSEIHPLIKEPNGLGQIQLEKVNLGEITWEFASEYPDSIFLTEGKKSMEFKTNISGEEISRSYSFFGTEFKIGHKLTIGNLDVTSYKIAWENGLIETEKVPKGKGFGLNSNFFSELVLNLGEQNVSRETFKDEKTFNEQFGVVRWVGLRRKYVAAVINFNRDTQNKISAKSLKPSDEFSQPTYSIAVSGNDFNPKDLNFDFVVLPLIHSELSQYKEGYEKILFSGYSWFFGADLWYPKLCGLVLNLLNKFHQWIPNYGIAIIFLTLLVRLILLPLTVSQTKAMSKQQELAPALKELREKYKSNPQKMFQAQRELYKEKGVSQAGFIIGCLPMFMQMPVFIALFNVLGRAVELRGAPFFAWIGDLSQPDVITTAVQVPFLFPMGLTILPFFMAITMFFQTKMTITDPNQKAMVYMMPIMMFFFSASFPSGLVLYWTVSNVFTIGQTKLLKRNKPSAPVEDSKRKLPANVVSKKNKGAKAS